MVGTVMTGLSARRFSRSSNLASPPVPDRVIREELRRAIAAQVRNDRPIAGRCQQRRNIDKAINVLGPAVQKNHHWSIGGTGFSVTDIEAAGLDLLQRSERRVRSRFD